MSPQIYNNIVLFIHLFNSKPKKILYMILNNYHFG